MIYWQSSDFSFRYLCDMIIPVIYGNKRVKIKLFDRQLFNIDKVMGICKAVRSNDKILQANLTDFYKTVNLLIQNVSSAC